MQPVNRNSIGIQEIFYYMDKAPPPKKKNEKQKILNVWLKKPWRTWKFVAQSLVPNKTPKGKVKWIERVYAASVFKGISLVHIQREVF